MDPLSFAMESRPQNIHRRYRCNPSNGVRPSVVLNAYDGAPLARISKEAEAPFDDGQRAPFPYAEGWAQFIARNRGLASNLLDIARGLLVRRIEGWIVRARARKHPIRSSHQEVAALPATHEITPQSPH